MKIKNKSFSIMFFEGLTLFLLTILFLICKNLVCKLILVFIMLSFIEFVYQIIVSKEFKQTKTNRMIVVKFVYILALMGLYEFVPHTIYVRVGFMAIIVFPWMLIFQRKDNPIELFAIIFLTTALLS